MNKECWVPYCSELVKCQCPCHTPVDNNYDPEYTEWAKVVFADVDAYEVPD